MTEFQEENTGGNNEPENNAAGGEAAPQRKERKPRTQTPKEPKLYPQWNEDGTPLLDEAGVQVQGTTKMKKPKAPKPPKEVEYQKDENGEFILDEEGNKIPVKKERAAPVRRVPSTERAIINISDEGMKRIANYKGARAQYAAPLRDGQFLGDYLEAGGDRGFLRFYVRDGAVTITVPLPEETQDAA